MHSRLSKHRALPFKGTMLLAGFLAAGLLAAGPQAASASGPFSTFDGSWSGGGTLTDAEGSTERLRCRARHTADSSGDQLGLDLRCASDSYKFELRASAVHRGGSVSGSWSELSRNIHGNLTGKVSGAQIEVLAESAGFSALITVSTRGSQQSVTITSPGSELRRVSVTLRRGGG